MRATRKSILTKSSIVIVGASGSPPGARPPTSVGLGRAMLVASAEGWALGLAASAAAGISNSSSSIVGSTRCIRCLKGSIWLGNTPASVQTKLLAWPNNSVATRFDREGKMGASMTESALKPANADEQICCKAARCEGSADARVFAISQGWAASKAWLI